MNCLHLAIETSQQKRGTSGKIYFSLPLPCLVLPIFCLQVTLCQLEMVRVVESLLWSLFSQD